MAHLEIDRAAIGRNARIGDLYDVRTDNFLSESLFKGRIGDDSVDSMDTPVTVLELVTTGSIQEKFDKLKIEGELQASIMSGIAKLSGTGGFLKEESRYTRSQQMSLIYQQYTTNENVNLRHVRGSINQEVLNKVSQGVCPATHAVVEIDWGAACYITCECGYTKEEDAKTVKGALEAQVSMLKLKLGGEEPNVFEKGANNENLQFTFRWLSDVSPSNRELPTSFEGALNLVKSLPELLKSVNGGKGVPLRYKLIPLDRVVQFCKLQMSIQLNFATLQEKQIESSVAKMEKLQEQSRQLRIIQTHLQRFKNYVTEDTLLIIDGYVEDVTTDLSKFRTKLHELITKIRHKEEQSSVLDSCLAKDVVSLAKHSQRIREFDSQCMILDDIQDWIKRGIQYIGIKDRFNNRDVKTKFVFYKAREPQDERTQVFFLRCQKTYVDDRNVKFAVIDQSIRPDLWTNRKKEAIEVYEDGMKRDHDLYEREGRDTDLCLMKHLGTDINAWVPSERTRVKLQCPYSFLGICARVIVTWQCSSCKHVVEYGIKTKKIYCACGESDPSRSLFRCNGNEHGIDYLSYPIQKLLVDLALLRAAKEKNILILGETGVGKSTWINSIFNYLSFGNLEEATVAKELKYLIPSRFTSTKDGISREIKIGEQSTKEVCKDGESATQRPTSYVFFVDDIRVRLIDTPGIGDTRGFKQDQKNLNMLLEYLSYYDELHAICILLKPNHSRLGVMFEFCIKGLLSQLHTSAKNNIVYCFTNARGTDYSPGDTLPVLQKMLREVNMTANPNNWFCFDNDSFRFLACYFAGVKYSQEEVENYSKSWNIAVKEAKRLLRHTDNICPHKVRNTISMNEARRVTLGMGKPMAEVTSAVSENLELIRKITAQLNDNHLGEADLRKNLVRKGYTIEYQQLPNPITVCADNRCLKVVEEGENRREVTTYPQVCHEPCNCFMWGLEPETKNSSRNMCVCTRYMYFGSKPCRVCTHSFKEHMYMTYKTVTFEKEFIEPNIQKDILALGTIKEQQEAVKNQYMQKYEELRYEEKALLTASAQFASFLNHGAIVRYNDALGDCLELAIDQEQKKPPGKRDDSKLHDLRVQKKQYETEKELIDEALKHGKSPLSPEEVMQIQQKLFGLKHFGQTLKEFFVGISISHSARNMEFSENMSPVVVCQPRPVVKDARTPTGKTSSDFVEKECSIQ